MCTTGVLTPDTMTCPFCDKHEQSMDELQTHIVSHLSTLPKVKKMNSQGPSWSMDMAVDSEAKKPRIQEDKKYQDITALIARSVLVQDMTLRELAGGVMHTFVIEKDHSVTTAMKQARESYFAKTEGKKPEEHQLGPPHIHVCQAMLQALTARPDTAGQHSKLK